MECFGATLRLDSGGNTIVNGQLSVTGNTSMSATLTVTGSGGLTLTQVQGVQSCYPLLMLVLQDHPVLGTTGFLEQLVVL